MRQTRWEWLARLVGMGSPTRRQKTAASGRAKDRYRITVGSNALVISAYTAGEARAEAKRLLGINVARGRLPVGSTVQRLS